MNDQGQSATTGPLDLLETLPIMILDVDRDGKLLFANRKVRERLGLPQELEDVALEDILDESSAKEAKQMLEELFGGESDITSTWRLQPEAGREFLVDSNAVSIYENGYPTRVRAYLHDGSEPVASSPAQDSAASNQLRSALKEEQEYTKALIQKSGLLVYILDTKGRIVEINKKMETVTGFSRENTPTLEKLLQGMYPEPKYRAIVERIHENMYKNQHIRETELAISTRSGEVKNISWSTARLKNARGQVHGFIAMGFDLTEKKRLEQWVKLQLSCFERVSDAVVVSDLEGHVINWLGRAERLLGYSPKEMIGKGLSTLFPEQEREQIAADMAESIERDGRWSREISVLDAGGKPLAVRFETTVIFNEKGTPIALVSILHDETKEKEYEEALATTRSSVEEYRQQLETREQEYADAQEHIEELEKRIDYLGNKVRDIEQEANRLASGRVALEEAIKELSIYQLQIQNTRSSAIITLDTSGVILTWSSGAEEITGVKANDAFNRPQDEVLGLDEFDWESLQSEATEKGHVVVPCTLTRADGRKQAIVLEVSVLTDEDDRPIGFAEVALKPLVPAELETELLDAKNLGIVGKLAGGMVRDVGDAFSALETNIRRLKTYIKDLRKVVELYRGGARNRDIEAFIRNVDLGSVLSDLDFLFDESEESLAHIRNLARDLAGILPDQPDVKEPQNLNDIAESAVSLVGADVGPRARVEKDYADPVLVPVHRSTCVRALVNLLLASVRAFDKMDPKANEIWVRTALDGELGVLEISHNGLPLPDDIGEHLGDFSYLATAGGFPYLALGTANRLIESLGGTLDVHTHPEGGAKFRTTFVCAEAEPVELPPEKEEASDKRPVLFVDDDKNLLRSFRRYFESWYDVFQANTSDEAKSALGVRQDFAAIVCDVLLPEEHGMALIREIAGQDPGVRDRMVFLLPPGLSGKARSQLVEMSRPAVGKPVDMASLKSIIDVVADRSGG